jgi:hypothetical protein
VSQVVDWRGLGEVLAVSLATGMVIVALFSLGVKALSLAERRSARPAERVGAWTGLALAGAGIVAVVTWGLVIIIAK